MLESTSFLSGKTLKSASLSSPTLMFVPVDDLRRPMNAAPPPAWLQSPSIPDKLGRGGNVESEKTIYLEMVGIEPGRAS
jgi:hypothetical protein